MESETAQPDESASAKNDIAQGDSRNEENKV
ncbi:hypothetical protein EMIT047CA2_80057 [Pseudomonas soli]